MQAKTHVHEKTGFLVCLLLFALFASACQEKETPDPMDYAIQMAESVMTRHPDSYFGWSYVTGVVMKAFSLSLRPW